jgi:DNA-binding response OmpR family regulator
VQAILITDNADEREIYAFILQQVGMTVMARSELEAAASERGSAEGDLFLVVSRSAETTMKAISRFRIQSQTPLFVLIDQPQEGQIADLLEAGADLVLPLPVSPRVLAAYCRNLLHRIGGVAAIAPAPISVGPVALDPSVRSVRVGRHKPQHLTQLEFRLLHLLMTHRGQVITPDVIVERVWGYDESGSRELVRGLISRLRSKIEPNPAKPKFIRTVSGVGYVFDAE